MVLEKPGAGAGEGAGAGAEAGAGAGSARSPLIDRQPGRLTLF